MLTRSYLKGVSLLHIVDRVCIEKDSKKSRELSMLNLEQVSEID